MKHISNRKVFIISLIAYILFIYLSSLIQSCDKLEFERVVRIRTGEVTDTTANSASITGFIQDVGETGITQHGHCWSTSENPTIYLGTKTEIGRRYNAGFFYSTLSGLLPVTTYYIRAYATYEGKTIYGDNITFTTYVTLPTVTTVSPSNITDNSATCGGNVTSDGGATVTARGVCWSTSQNPTTANSKTINGTGTGAFTSNLTGLFPNTIYYVRAYATNSQGTAYGNQVSFTTSESVTPPTVTTASVTSITSTTAQSGGNVTSDGGATVTSRGVCWSTFENPDLSDYYTINGSGTGSFISNLTGLAPNNTYYVRAYATNSAGTGYGNQVSFKTGQEITSPVVTTASISSITQSSAQSGGNVTSDGGATVTARGVCWNTSENPTLLNSHTTDGSGTGQFVSNITGLSPNTTYFLRAYATNSIGTSYGEEIAFATTEPITDYDGNIYKIISVHLNIIDFQLYII